MDSSLTLLATYRHSRPGLILSQSARASGKGNAPRAGRVRLIRPTMHRHHEEREPDRTSRHWGDGTLTCHRGVGKANKKGGQGCLMARPCASTARPVLTPYPTRALSDKVHGSKGGSRHLAEKRTDGTFPTAGSAWFPFELMRSGPRPGSRPRGTPRKEEGDVKGAFQVPFPPPSQRIPRLPVRKRVGNALFPAAAWRSPGGMRGRWECAC